MNIFKKTINKIINRNKIKMENEIIEQPDIIFELIRKYINKDYSINMEFPQDIETIALIASGSSYHSAAIIADFLTNKVLIPSKAYYSSEIVIRDNFFPSEKTLYIFISQSGETSDTNAALDRIKNTTEKTFAVTNVKNSKLWNSAKYKMLTFAGTEKAVASTKTMSAQLFCLFLFAIKLMKIKKIPYMNYIDDLINVPEYIKNIFTKREQIKKYANTFVNYENTVILASGIFYPLGKEGALKIQETSYINASAYPTGEFLHGHIAILNKKCAVIMLVDSCNIQFTVDILMKINNHYKTDILLISSLNINDADKNDFIYIDTKSEINYLFSSLAIFQLLALETAVLLNRNIDKPVGLTKVVK